MPQTEIDMQRVTVIDGPLPPGVFQDADREPGLVTAPEHEAVLRELTAREPLFHRAESGITRNDFERMTAPEYWEVGGFHGLEIAVGNYLLTYTLAQGERASRSPSLVRLPLPRAQARCPSPSGEGSLAR
jgi:hypothetical protein